MILKNGNLKLDTVDFDHIQGKIDEEHMTLQDAFESELAINGLKLKEVYTIEINMGKIGKHLELYCQISCEVQSGRKRR